MNDASYITPELRARRDEWTREVVRFSDVRLLVPALVGWALLAMTLTWSTGPRWAVTGAVTLALVVAAFVGRGRSRGHGLLVVLGVALLVQVGGNGQHALRAIGDLDTLTAARAVVTLDVTVTSDPVQLAARGSGDPVVMARAKAHRVMGRGRESPAYAPISLRGDGRLLDLRWHDSVRVRGRLAPPQPGYPELAVVRVTEAEVVARAGALARVAEHLRAGLRTAVDPTPADARGLLPGLVIGDTSRTPPDLTEAMQATGMTHLTAVSGSNIAVVGGMVLGLCVLVGVPRRWRPPVVALAILGFVVLARPEPSVVRAAAMGLIGLIGMSRSQRSAGLPVLSGAIVVVLVIDPWMSRSFGFALSALATLGLLLFTRPWGDAIARHLPARLSFMGPAIAIPVAAQAMCAPLIVLLQGSVSIVGVVANLVAAPLVAPATIAGVAAALVSVVADAPAQLVGWIGAVPTLGIARTARVMADVPGGTMPWPDGAFGAVLLTVITLLLLLTGRWLGAMVVLKPLAALLVVALTVAMTMPTRVVTWPPEGWRIAFCDVGQGDAAVIRTGVGRALVVDTGPEPGPVDGCLDSLGVHTVEAVVLTHFHADHVEGLPGVLSGRQVGQVLVSPIGEPDHQVREVAAWTGADGIPVSALAAGDRLTFGDVTAEVWAPVRRIAAGSVPNNASVVLAVHVGEVDALLLGDIERESAHDLLLRMRRDAEMSTAATQFDVVKTPHHGSANLDADLMEAVRAPVAVISVGKDNDYGHPTAAHLAMLQRNGYAAYRTDQRGHIALVERDGHLTIVTSK
ncbi:ComEC/Rec2 family competence protein [Knoellia subterranea]|uniref:Membrane protein n=1 Tax=Knoellia subterranea KCTC 19937 TaxID=1385521 RepID=A0A0A0JHF6_9MICO|nr:ComEC/Rec2 family competence protein [Knoellia subterranea]KGN35482.1 membrane protein [Knoellia subterranea KCTC 19937]